MKVPLKMPQKFRRRRPSDLYFFVMIIFIGAKSIIIERRGASAS